MKDVLKKLRKKAGFTLAELLIVVAIIAVLVAIAIPVFTSQLEKSRESTDIANVRSAYAEVVTAYLTEGDSAATITVTAQQTVDSWQGETGKIEYFSGNQSKDYTYSAATGTYTVGITIDSSTGDAKPNVTVN